MVYKSWKPQLDGHYERLPGPLLEKESFWCPQAQSWDKNSSFCPPWMGVVATGNTGEQLTVQFTSIISIFLEQNGDCDVKAPT